MLCSLIAMAAMAQAAVIEQPTAEILPVAPQSSSQPSAYNYNVPDGTPVRLMVTRELTSRTVKNGDRFKLRVDEPVFVNGQVVIPVGATAWGEIVSFEKNGAAGKGGKLAARLLYVEMPDGNLPLKGDMADRGGERLI